MKLASGQTRKPAFFYADNFYPLTRDSYRGREATILNLNDKKAITNLHKLQPYRFTEAPEMWAICIGQCRQMNQTKVIFLNDGTAPRGVDTWMLYQALAGVWPATLALDDETALHALEARFVEFVQKALREAKLHMDWVDNNEAYENVVLDYVRHLLSPENEAFLQIFSDGLEPFMRAGLVNSLTLAVIKFAAPGVPDIYQGSETLSFSLVDPDNLREPDFALLEHMLAGDALPNFNAEEDWLDGKVKLQTTACMLGLRQGKPDLFRKGDYLPLSAIGKRANNVIGFARLNDSDAFIMIAPRLVFEALHGGLTLPPTACGRRRKSLYLNPWRTGGIGIFCAKRRCFLWIVST